MTVYFSSGLFLLFNKYLRMIAFCSFFLISLLFSLSTQQDDEEDDGVRKSKTLRKISTLFCRIAKEQMRSNLFSFFSCKHQSSTDDDEDEDDEVVVDDRDLRKKFGFFNGVDSLISLCGAK